MTAQQYGVSGYPVIILLDRAGKIAFRSDTAAGNRNLTAIFRQVVQNPKAITEEKAIELIERTLAEEIERALKHK